MRRSIGYATLLLPKNLLLIGYDHHTRLLLSVHHDLQRLVKPHVAHVLRLLHCRHCVEDILLEHPVAGISVDGEVPHPERCKVLEEMSACEGST